MLGRQVAAIVWRTYAQARLEEMAAHAGVPVVNALTDDFHPCQLLADLLTVREHKGELAGLTLAFFGDGANNMGTPTCSPAPPPACTCASARPTPTCPTPAWSSGPARSPRSTGGSVALSTDDPVEAAAGADVVATDTWVSMGKEDEAGPPGHPSRRTRWTSRADAAAKPDAISSTACPPTAATRSTPR